MNALAEQPNGLPEMLAGNILANRSNGTEPEACLTNALRARSSEGIEIISLVPERVELRVQSHLAVISPLQELVTQLEAGLSPEVSEAIRARRAQLFLEIGLGKGKSHEVFSRYGKLE